MSLKSNKKMNLDELQILSHNIRKKILELALKSDGPSHLGGGLSMVDFFSVLYGNILNHDPLNPNWENRDRFILSKGHGVLPYFVTLFFSNYITEEELYTYKKNESHLISHPVMNLELGIESSNGSLGHGLSMAVGIAIASKKKARSNKVFVVLGDGECNEGSIWEAAMSAAHFKLDNLVAVLDYNKLQSDGFSENVMDIGNLSQKWESFGWDTISVDGHNISEIYSAFNKEHHSLKPKILIASTIKGKGVSFMENNNAWHHNRLTQNFYDQAILELQKNI
jgi:transketolase